LKPRPFQCLNERGGRWRRWFCRSFHSILRARYGVDGVTVEVSGKVSVGKIKSEIRRVEWYIHTVSTLSIMWGSQSCLSNSYRMSWLLFISAFKIAGHIEWSQVSTSWEAIISGKIYRPMKSNKPLWFDACVATRMYHPSCWFWESATYEEYCTDY
jgi:hypothetical protein